MAEPDTTTEPAEAPAPPIDWDAAVRAANARQDAAYQLPVAHLD